MLRSLILSAGALAFLSACGSETAAPETAAPEATPTDVDTAVDGPTAPVNVEARIDGIALFTFDCGRIVVSDLDIFAMDGSFSGQSETFANPCFLIRHPEGDLLWDVGLSDALVGGEPQTDGPFTVSLKASLRDQMSEVGIDPDEIDFISVSHNHFDHTGQPQAAPNAVWLVHQDEYNVMMGENPPGDYTAFAALGTEVFAGDYDVFGDSRVKILSMPGHTPGHTALLVDLPETGRVLLSGDKYHRLQSREDPRNVPRINFDEEMTRDSMERFEAIANATGARVVIQHAQSHFDALPKPPDALR